MAPSQSRSRHRTFGQKSPEKTQPPGLDAVLERLHKIFGFPLPCAVTGKKGPRDAYISKLESLLKLDSGRVNHTIASLEAQQLASRQHSTRRVQNLMVKFDELLENELSQLRDDRDRSILDLIGLTSGEERDVGLKVGIVKKQQADEFEYDGRFDDPVTEHASPAASADRASTHPCSNINAFVSRISELTSKSTNTLLPSSEDILKQQNPRYLNGIRVSLEIPADANDSDESFYSCPGTSENLPGENIEGGNVHLRPNSTNSRGDTVPTIHHSTPKPEFAQKNFYPRLSQKGKEPSLSPNPPRKFYLSQFPRSKQWDCEQVQSASGTTPTCSTESSFNASSSFSNRLGTDWSPPTSLETSFNEDTESLTRPTKQKGPRLAILEEGLDETKFLEDAEAPYNGDCETTDIDDSDVSYEQSRVTSKRASEKRPLSQRNVSTIPKPDGRKFDQPNHQTREEEDAAFQKLAKDFFGDEYEPNPPVHTFLSVGGAHPMNEHAACILGGEGAQEGEDPLLREIGEEGFAGEWDNINNTLELADETQKQRDDEDEFGAIDPHFEKAFSGKSSPSHVFPSRIPEIDEMKCRSIFKIPSPQTHNATLLWDAEL